MTDKELDQKLTAAFDNVRADSAVKARIRKGLTGDIMDSNKTITVSKTADKNERTGTIKVNRRGRIAAAVIAGVLAVGGGSYLLNGGFVRVEPNTSLSSKTDSDSSSAHSDKMTYNGKEVDEMPITNEQLGFDPSGNSIYDKFSGYCDIRNLPNGNFLVRLQTAIPIEDDVISTCYCVYDPSVNSITGILPTNDWNCYSIGKNSIVFCSTDRDAENKIGDDKGKVFTTNLSCKLYDLDLCEMKNDTLNFQLGDKHVEEVMVSSDNKIYVAAREDYSDNKEKLYIYDSEGSVINTSEECDGIYSCSMSLDGGFIYYATQNRDSWSTTLKCIAVDDKHIDCEHTDGVYDDNPWSHYAMYFDSGKYLYTVYYTDEGKQMIRRIDMTGEEEIYFGEPEDVINYAGDVADYRYVTPDGKYLFTYNVKDKYTEDGGIEREYEIISAYDIENGLKLVHEEKVNDFMWLSSYGLNLLYNGATGDVCFGGYKDEDEKMFAEICFNLFGKEFSNFGIKKSAKDNNEVEDTNTSPSIPDVSGLECEAAEDALKAAGYTVILKSKYDIEKPEGNVIKTEPAAGTEFDTEEPVTMYVSKGKIPEDYEYLIGLIKIPEGLRGRFTVDLDSDDYHYSNDFIGEDMDRGIALGYAGKDTGVFTVTITNRDTGKSVEYYKEEINFKAGGERKTISDYDTEGLLAICSDEEIKASEVTLSIPIPEGLHGPYTAKVGDERISGDADKKEPISVTLTGRGIKEYHVEIDSNETHKSFNGGIYSVNFDENTVERLDNNCLYDTYYISDDGKLCLLYDGLLLPEGLHGTYTADIISDNDSYTDTLYSDETLLAYFPLKFNGNGTQTYTVKFTNDETGNSVKYCKFKVNFEDMELSYISEPNKDGLLAISPKD